MTHNSLHCVSSTVKTPFHAKYFQASIQENQGCSTWGKELGVTTALAVPSPAWVPHSWMGWAQQVLQPHPLMVPQEARVIQHILPGSPLWTSRNQGQRKEWKQHYDAGWKTRDLQCRSEAHPREGDRDSPGDKVWNTGPESLGRKCVGGDWSQQLSIGALRALTWAEKFLPWRACSLIKN